MKLTMLVVFLFSVSGCSLQLINRHLDLSVQIPSEITTPTAAIRWVSEHIVYYNSDHFQTPKETTASKRGDCRAFVLLTMALLREMGVSSYFIFTHLPGRPIASHAEIEVVIGGVLVQLDPQIGIVPRAEPIDKKWSWEDLEQYLNANGL
jgi:hypothetical protein